MPSQLEEAALRFRGQLLRQERQAASEMVRAYAAAWQRTRARLAELQEQIDAARASGLIPGPFTPRQPGGPVIEQAPGTFSLSWLYERDRLTTLLRQIEGELRQFGALAGELTEAGQLQAVRAAQANTAELVRQGAAAANAPEIVGMFDRLPTAAVQDLVGFASDGSPLRELFDALGPQVSTGVQNALVTAVATGIGPRETARLVRQQFGVGLSRALTIARTEQIRAYREASRRSYAENADLLDGWVWLSAHDGRTCPSCWAMHGTRHRVTETLDDHPRGRCVMVPIVKGHDPEIRTGEELFKDLPPAQQRSILGPAAHLAYQNGAVTLGDFVGRRDDPVWGTMRYAKSLREVVGNKEARRYIDQVRVPPARPAAIDPTTLTVGQFKTIDEATAWAKHNYRKIDWELEGLHVDTINPTLKEFDRLAKEWPDVAKRVEYIGTRQTRQVHQWRPNEWAHASRDGSVIGLNPTVYSDPVRLLNELQRSEDANWHPKGTGKKIDSVITHEFGHQVENWLLSQPGTVAFHSKVIGADGLGLVYDTVAGWLNGHKATSALSDYAVTTNHDFRKAEGWAEAFASIRYTPKKQWTKFTRDLASLLETVGDSSAWVTYSDSSAIPWAADLPADQRIAAMQELQKLRKKLGLK